MKNWLPATALRVALMMSVAVASGYAMGSASAAGAVHAGATFGGRAFGSGFGFHHGFGFGHRFPPANRIFRQPRFNFGAGFVSHRGTVVAGGYGDDDSTSGDYGSYSDDIEDLHFRVQEPFGPGDIGQPPIPAGEDSPYAPDRMYPGGGYEPRSP